MKKAKHIIKGICSGIIWGSGQLLNKQFLKALFFFAFFLLFVGIEIGTGNYIDGYDPYDAQIAGEDYYDNLAKQIYEFYTLEKKNNKINSPEFEKYYEEHKTDGFTNEELIEFLALEIKGGSHAKYYLINKYTSDLKDKATDINKEDASGMKKVETVLTTYRSPSGVEYARRVTGSGSAQKIYYANVNNDNDTLTAEDIKGFEKLERKNVLYFDEATSKVYLQVSVDNSIAFYENVQDKSDVIEAANFDEKLYKKVGNYVGTLHYNESGVYGLYDPEVNGYKATEFTKFFSQQLTKLCYQSAGVNATQDDLARFKLKVYFAMHEDVKNDFEERFDNFFYNRAGFFLQGFWGVITIGTTDSADYYQITLLSEAIKVTAGTPLQTVIVRGHLSSYILIRSLIALILFAFFMIILVWSAKDAYNTSKTYDETGEKISTKEYFKGVYEGAFEYIILFPAIFTIAFISVMPILFSFLVAFTSYSGVTADVGLFDWVGFKNFTQIFTFGGDIPFGSMFWKVFLWTVIWAVASTVTVFFGGFFQALILNSERVPLKKFWRTILILPWAIPAMITQMVFANFFAETGVMNALLQQLGVYDVLKSWGILGREFSSITGNGFTEVMQRFFYLGNENIQWFGNPYNKNFVRTVLIIVNIWLGFPYYMALMTGIMVGLDKSLYEAAEIDGAEKFDKFKYITFPLVMYSTAPLLVMCFSGNFNNFGMIYFVTQGGYGAGDLNRAFAGDTDILISWMYSLTVDHKTYNMASVFSILIFIIVGSIAAWNYSRTKAFKED